MASSHASGSQEVDADMVFVLLMLEEDSAPSEVHVRLRMDEEDSGIVVEPADRARGKLPDQQVCVVCMGVYVGVCVYVCVSKCSGRLSTRQRLWGAPCSPTALQR